MLFRSKAAGPPTIESHALQTQAYQSWQSALERDRERLSSQVRSATNCIADSKREVAYAEKNLANYREQTRAYKKKSMGVDTTEQMYLKNLERAKTELNQCESQFSLAWNQLGIAERDLASIKSRFQALGPPPSEPQPLVAAVKPVPQLVANTPSTTPSVAKALRPVSPATYRTERPIPPPVPSGDEFMSVLNSKVSNTEPPVSTVGVGRWKIPSPFQLIYDVMTGKGTMITIVGLVITIVGTLWLLAAAFIEGIFWGLACVAIPFANLFFAVMHFSEAKWPLLVTVVGWLLMYAGVYGS